MNDFGAIVRGVAESFRHFTKVYRRFKRSTTRWRIMAKNGQNKKTRRRNQVMLKGRGCKVRTGMHTRKGKH